MLPTGALATVNFNIKVKHSDYISTETVDSTSDYIYHRDWHDYKHFGSLWLLFIHLNLHAQKNHIFFFHIKYTVHKKTAPH